MSDVRAVFRDQSEDRKQPRYIMCAVANGDSLYYTAYDTKLGKDLRDTYAYLLARDAQRSIDTLNADEAEQKADNVFTYTCAKAQAVFVLRTHKDKLEAAASPWLTKNGEFTCIRQWPLETRRYAKQFVERCAYATVHDLVWMPLDIPNTTKGKEALDFVLCSKQHEINLERPMTPYELFYFWHDLQLR